LAFQETDGRSENKSLPQERTQKFAIETLKIEQAQLMIALRKIQSMAVTREDYPAAAADENEQFIRELERAKQTGRYT
jgi:hypothetical protein